VPVARGPASAGGGGGSIDLAHPTGPQTSGPQVGGTADHTRFEILQQDFASGPEDTEACLSCHTETGGHFMANVHCTWEHEHPETGQLLGKKHLVNNFCTNARGNEGMCAHCHAGCGWRDKGFDFTDQTKIDCLVCHDTTHTYYKTPDSKWSPYPGLRGRPRRPAHHRALVQGACHAHDPRL
jgi:hypothetical protein